jgi:aspartyl-tRNA(Asn)/glutamyl-tRNA(Gln) amidotransferase subunit C
MAERKISLEQVKHVAKLSRLSMTEDEARAVAEQLEQILEYVAMIGELDVNDVEPMSHGAVMRNVLRDDVVEPSLPLEEVLKNAPERDGPFFKVPKVIGAGEDPAG